MTNEEMMRPCTLWGETFDAGDVLQVRNTETHVFIDLNTVKLINGHPVFGKVIASPFYDECHVESQKYTLEAITTIADALNAPVLATDAVLAGLPKDAKVWKVWDDGLELCFIRWFNKRWAYNVVDAHSTMTGGGCHVEFKEKELCSADRIKPDDPKTAEYLRQFTLDGVRIKEGG
jgi:hypothetical protein